MPRWSIMLAAVLLLTASAEASPQKPNILFILADDQRFDLLGCAGHPILKTPQPERFPTLPKKNK